MDIREFRDRIRYPTSWSYTVIGRSRDELVAAIGMVLTDHEHEVAHSNTSSGGKYLSLSVTLRVSSEELRLEIYEALWQQDAVLKVL